VTQVLLALLLQMQGFCERHLVATIDASYTEMSNLELIANHLSKATAGSQTELLYRVQSGTITATEISLIKNSIENGSH